LRIEFDLSRFFNLKSEISQHLGFLQRSLLPVCFFCHSGENQNLGTKKEIWIPGSAGMTSFSDSIF